MKVLIDTHVFLWILVSPKKLSSRARSIIESGDNHVLLSTASLWEIAIKEQVGKLFLPNPPERYLRRRIAESDIEMLPVSAQHALRLFSLPVHHKDPFDRIIVAQSQEEDIAIITADAVMRRYEIEVIW